MIQRDIEIINLSHEVTKPDGSNNGIWYFKDQIKLNDELIIGFSPTNYHCFIICGEYEFHPRFTTNPCKVVPSRKDNIRAALFVRITGLEKERLNYFQCYLKSLKGQRTPSCQEGLLQVLDKGLGLKIPDTKISRILPYTFITELFFNGLIDKDNKKVNFKIYTTRDKPLATVFKEIGATEEKLTWVFNLSSFIYTFVRLIFPWKVVR